MVSSLKGQSKVLFFGCTTFYRPRCPLSVYMALDIFSGQLLLLSGNNWGNETIGIADTLDECRHSNRS